MNAVVVSTVVSTAYVCMVVDRMEMSLPKKKKKKVCFKETPTSPYIPFRTRFWPLC